MSNIAALPAWASPVTSHYKKCDCGAKAIAWTFISIGGRERQQAIAMCADCLEEEAKTREALESRGEA